MKDILGMISLTTAASVLLILAAVWLIVLIIKKQHEYIFRAMMIMLVLLLGLIFLRQHEAGKLTLPEIKLRLLPEKPIVYNFQQNRAYVAGREETHYKFLEPNPRLPLKLDPNGTYFHISDIKPINRMLKHLKLPEIEHAVPELASITGSKSHTNMYRWDDYAAGTLIIMRTLCQDPLTLEVYQGVAVVRVFQ